MYFIPLRTIKNIHVVTTLVMHPLVEWESSPYTFIKPHFTTTDVTGLNQNLQGAHTPQPPPSLFILFTLLSSSYLFVL